MFSNISGLASSTKLLSTVSGMQSLMVSRGLKDLLPGQLTHILTQITAGCWREAPVSHCVALSV